MEKQLQHLIEQQQHRSLTAQERAWVVDNFPESETQLDELLDEETAE